MTDAERKERAIKYLKERLPVGSTVYTMRIDYGRSNVQKYYYATIIVHDGKPQNVSGMVARATDMKWSNTNGNGWANSSAVYAQTASDVVEQLGFALYDDHNALIHDQTQL